MNSKFHFKLLELCSGNSLKLFSKGFSMLISDGFKFLYVAKNYGPLKMFNKLVVYGANRITLYTVADNLINCRAFGITDHSNFSLQFFYYGIDGYTKKFKGNGN